MSGETSVMRERERTGARPTRHPDDLTDRQLEAVRLYALGAPMREIAARMGVRRGTAVVHLRAARRILGERDRIGVLRWALATNVIDLESWLEGA